MYEIQITVYADQMRQIGSWLTEFAPQVRVVRHVSGARTITAWSESRMLSVLDSYLKEGSGVRVSFTETFVFDDIKIATLFKLTWL